MEKCRSRTLPENDKLQYHKFWIQTHGVPGATPLSSSSRCWTNDHLDYKIETSNDILAVTSRWLNKGSGSKEPIVNGSMVTRGGCETISVRGRCMLPPGLRNRRIRDSKARPKARCRIEWYKMCDCTRLLHIYYYIFTFI